MTGKILIVDGVSSNRILLKVTLGAAGHAVMQAGTGAEALEQIGATEPALVMIDNALPDMTGTALCARLRAEARLNGLPIILIGTGLDRATRLAALEAGADEVLAKPLNEAVLMARLRSLLRTRQIDLDLRLRAETCRDFGLAEAPQPFAFPPQVGLIALDLATAIGWRAELAPHLNGTYRPQTAAAALAEADAPGAPDLYVIAADLERGGEGLRLLADLRARLGAREAGVCLALPRPWDTAAALALDLGACDLLPLPMDGAEAALRLTAQMARLRRSQALRRAVSEGLQQAATDALTGLWNRRYALAHLDRVAARSLATGTPCAVMLLDLDRFKMVNDRFGHAAGDAVLETVATRLLRGMDGAGLLARIGGEEFLVVLDDITPVAARSVAERLCALVATGPISLPGGMGPVTVTLSAGLALSAAPAPGDWPERAADPTEAGRTLARRLLDLADSALFAAKGDGRNQVTSATAA